MFIFETKTDILAVLRLILTVSDSLEGMVLIV